MGIFDRLHSRSSSDDAIWQSRLMSNPPAADLPGEPTDKQAIARYRYLLRTAPPETIEHAHAAAFAQMTPEQRQLVFQELCHDVSAYEWESGLRYGDDPRSLARMATRAELQRPGSLEQTFDRISLPDTNLGLGGPTTDSFLTSFAGMIVGSWVATQFFAEAGYDQGLTEGSSIAGGTTPARLGQDTVLSETYAPDSTIAEDWGEIGGDR